MKKFTFRLASLLTLRISERDAARRSVAEAMQAINILEAQIREKDQAIADLKMQRSSSLQGRVSVDDLLSYGRYEMVFQIEKKNLQDQLQKVQAECQKRQVLLRSADQEVKRIEKLRDHALQSHRDSERSIAQAEMDEVASVRYQMTRNERG